MQRESLLLMMVLQVYAALGLSLFIVMTAWYPTLNLSVMNSVEPIMIIFPLLMMAILLESSYAYYR